jgi:hypothetical protein
MTTTAAERANALVCPAWCTAHSIDVDAVAMQATHVHQSAVTLVPHGSDTIPVRVRQVVGYAHAVEAAGVEVGEEIWGVTKAATLTLSDALRLQAEYL